MNFKVNYYANSSGIVKAASKWHEQPHRLPLKYFSLGDIAPNLAPFYINWPSGLPVVYRSIRGNEVEQIGATFAYCEWLEMVTCRDIGLTEEMFFRIHLWCKFIDEYCSLILSKTDDEGYVVTERINGFAIDDKVLCQSIHFLEAVLFMSAYIRGAK
jgi:hypothetical protein